MGRNLHRHTIQVVAWAILLAGTSLFAQEQFIDTQTAAEPAPKTHKVLVINSYHRGYFWSDNIIKAIMNQFNKNHPNANLFFEYMDTKFHMPDKVFEPLKELYKLKYKDSQPDVIISSDNNAFDFLRRYRDELFPGVPVVFCGVGNFSDSMLKGHERITGVVEKSSLFPTVRIALKLHPLAKQIVFLNYRPMLYLSETTKEIQKIKSGIKVVCFSPPQFTPQQVVEKLDKFGDETILITLNPLSDPAPKDLTVVKEFAAMLSRRCASPLYSISSNWLGGGVVGGNVAEPFNQGDEAAQMAIRILNGESCDNIPIIRKSPNDYMFDYIQLKRFGISLSDLPEGSIIINEPRSFYYRYKEYVWIVSVVIVVLGAMVVILSANILAHKKTQKALQRTQFAVDNASIEIYWIGSDARFLYTNKATTDILGYSQQELLSMTVHDIDPDFSEEVWPAHWEEVRRRKSFAFESRHRTKDGRIFPVEITVNYIEFDGKEYNYAFAHDISGRKQMEKMLRETEKLAAAGRLAARIAHEINNPLAGIKNSFTLVKDAVPQDHRYYDYVARIDNEIMRVSRIVRQMFDLYRPELESVNKFRLGDIIGDVVALVEVANTRQIKNFEVDIKDNSTVVTLAEGLFRQTLFNIIQNAIEASEPGMTIKVSAGISDDMLTVKIADQGSGIAAEIRDRIFEPFFTTKKDYAGSGLGLGLAVCKSSVEAMAGDITVESGPNTGTVFSITIPLNAKEGRRKNG